MSRRRVLTTGLAGLFLGVVVWFSVARPAAIPPFPWTTFAKGDHAIMREPGIKTAGQLGACPAPGREVEVVQWMILRASGERWVLFGALPSPNRWVAVRLDVAGDPDLWYAGTHDGDAITVTQSARYDHTRHGDGPCPYLTAPSA